MNLGWKFMLPLAFINLMICAGVAILDVETEGKMGALPIWGIGIVSLGIVAWALSLFKEKEGQAYDVMSTQQEVAK